MYLCLTTMIAFRRCERYYDDVARVGKVNRECKWMVGKIELIYVKCTVILAHILRIFRNFLSSLDIYWPIRKTAKNQRFKEIAIIVLEYFKQLLLRWNRSIILCFGNNCRSKNPKLQTTRTVQWKNDISTYYSKNVANCFLFFFPPLHYSFVVVIN